MFNPNDALNDLVVYIILVLYINLNVKDLDELVNVSPYKAIIINTLYYNGEEELELLIIFEDDKGNDEFHFVD